MNDFFSLTRWWKCISIHWVENRKRYLLSMLALAGIAVAWYIFLIKVTEVRALTAELQVATYFVGLFITGALYASYVFSETNHKARGIAYLSFPASHLEKLLVGVFFALPVFFVAYTAVFYAVDIPMMEIASQIVQAKYPDTQQQLPETVNVFTVLRDDRTGMNPAYYLILAFVAMQAAYILGSIYFTGYNFIKTTIGLVAVLLLTMLYFGKVLTPTLPDNTFYWSLTSLKVAEDIGAGKLVKLPEFLEDLVKYAFQFLFAPIFLAAAYFRLKEKEI